MSWNGFALQAGLFNTNGQVFFCLFTVKPPKIFAESSYMSFLQQQPSLYLNYSSIHQVFRDITYIPSPHRQRLALTLSTTFF